MFFKATKPLFSLVVAAALVAGFVPATQHVAAQDVKTGGIIRVARASGSYTNNSNPFGTAGQNLPSTPLIYEPLFFVNGVTGDVTPLLGLSYEWSDDNLQLTVKTREGVQWSDGEAFSASDVAFTFNYLSEFPELDTAGLWAQGLAGVEAPDETTVVFTFSEANTTLFNDIVARTIAPEHIWADVADPVQETNENPVGTGPFLLDSFAPQLIKVVKNPNYWLKGQPYADGVTWQVTNSNQSVLLLLLQNQADYAYSQIPNVEQTYNARDPETYVSWWPVNNDNILYLNTLKAPMDDVTFRKAVAMAIDKDDVALKAYAGTTVAASSPTGIIPAQQADWLDEGVQEAAYSFDPEAARALLEEAGYTWDGDTLLGKDGQPLPAFNILVGAGWTDFITMAQVISQNLGALGIRSSIQQENWGSYSRGLQSGTYDMAISWGWGNGSTPYYLYNRSLAPEFSAEGIGETADSNFSRFTDPTITEALSTFRESSDQAEQKEAINQIAQIVVEQVPYVPITDRVNFSNFNLSTFTGWPSPENPYTDGGPDDSAAGLLMFREVHLK